MKHYALAETKLKKTIWHKGQCQGQKVIGLGVICMTNI